MGNEESCLFPHFLLFLKKLVKVEYCKEKGCSLEIETDTDFIQMFDQENSNFSGEDSMIFEVVMINFESWFGLFEVKNSAHYLFFVEFMCGRIGICEFWFDGEFAESPVGGVLRKHVTFFSIEASGYKSSDNSVFLELHSFLGFFLSIPLMELHI